MKTNPNHMQTKNLNEDMTCPICHSSEISDYLELYRCKICTHMFSKNLYDDNYWQDLYKNKFDFIQFRGVLQNSVDPVNNLKHAINILEKDGVIIITSLPDFSSLTSRFYKQNFGFYAPELSPHFFTKKSFLFMLDSLGLKVLAYDSPYLKTPYANLPKDLLLFFINKFRNKTNPPFFGNVKNYLVK